MSPQKVPVWTWRDAIRRAKVAPLTKHVCNMIANYISDVGAGCYPGTKLLMEDTGLSNRALATHLRKAKDAGLLEIKRAPGKSGRFDHNHYYPRFPNNVDLPRVDPSSSDVSQNQVKESHLARPSEGKSLGPREPDDQNRVNQPSEGGSRKLSTQNYSKNTPARSRAKISNYDLKVQGLQAAPGEYTITSQDGFWQRWLDYLDEHDRPTAKRMRGHFIAWVPKRLPSEGLRPRFPGDPVQLDLVDAVEAAA